MLSSHKTQQHSAANPTTIMSLATSENLTQAYQWAGKSRGNSSSNNSSWCARDVVVLKARARQLQFTPDTYPHCRHLAAAGGIHAEVQQIHAEQSNYTHILKSDIYHYYESIDHQVLLLAFSRDVACAGLNRLIAQFGIYIDRWTSRCNGLFQRCNEACSKLSMDLPAIPHENQMGGFTENPNEDFIA